MITKKQWLKARNGTAFYWKDDNGMVMWIFVKISNKEFMYFFGWDIRDVLLDNAGKIISINNSSWEELTQVEKETQDLIYKLEG